jgi:hypothetical protein
VAGLGFFLDGYTVSPHEQWTWRGHLLI